MASFSDISNLVIKIWQYFQSSYQNLSTEIQHYVCHLRNRLADNKYNFVLILPLFLSPTKKPKSKQMQILRY